ncbi:hypothetical protein KIN20_028370, partial [Parelaphostrongylus tenuis]
MAEFPRSQKELTLAHNGLETWGGRQNRHLKGTDFSLTTWDPGGAVLRNLKTRLLKHVQDSLYNKYTSNKTKRGPKEAR